MLREADVVAAMLAAGRAGVLLDLDGTLAPIVARPELARVSPEVSATIGRLAARVALVAVISGRPSDQVRRLLGVPGVEVVGTHGLEGERPMAADVLRAIEEVAAAVGAWVEPKGAAAAVHFRAAPDPDAAAAAAAPRLAAAAAAHGLELLSGKRILELTPSGRPRKGGAVERIVRDGGLDAVLFAGDDVGDLDAFASLDRLRTEGLWTCRVVARGPETPAAVVGVADLVVEGPEGVAALLARISDGPV